MTESPFNRDELLGNTSALEEPLLQETHLDSTSLEQADHVDIPSERHIRRRSSIKPPIKLYYTRFYVLVIFCGMMFLYVLLGIGYAPIAYRVSEHYHISTEQVALLVNWCAILYIPALPVVTMISGKAHPLRNTALFATALMLVAATVRITPDLLERHAGTALPSWLPESWLVHLSTILNAFAGPCMWSNAPLVSATWFGTGERTTATGVISSANSMGAVTAFAFIPLIVQNPSDIPTMDTVLVGVAALLFLSVLLYLPPAPPSPPCHLGHIQNQLSMEAKRTKSHSILLKLDMLAIRNTLSKYRDVLTNRSCMCLQLSCGIAIGCFFSYQNLLNIMLGEDATAEASMLGSCSTFAGLVGSLIAGPLAELCFSGHLKRLLLASNLLSLIAMGLFTLSLLPPPNPVMVESYWRTPLLVVVGATGGISLPVCLELGVELAYPVTAAIPSALFSSLLQFSQFSFLLAVPHLMGKYYWSPCMAALLLLSTLLLFGVKEEYNRTIASRSRRRSSFAAALDKTPGSKREHRRNRANGGNHGNSFVFPAPRNESGNTTPLSPSSPSLSPTTLPPADEPTKKRIKTVPESVAVSNPFSHRGSIIAAPSSRADSQPSSSRNNSEVGSPPIRCSMQSNISTQTNDTDNRCSHESLEFPILGSPIVPTVPFIPTHASSGSFSSTTRPFSDPSLVVTSPVKSEVDSEDAETDAWLPCNSSSFMMKSSGPLAIAARPPSGVQRSYHSHSSAIRPQLSGGQLHQSTESVASGGQSQVSSVHGDSYERRDVPSDLPQFNSTVTEASGSRLFKSRLTAEIKESEIMEVETSMPSYDESESSMDESDGSSSIGSRMMSPAPTWWWKTPKIFGSSSNGRRNSLPTYTTVVGFTPNTSVAPRESEGSLSGNYP